MLLEQRKSKSNMLFIGDGMVEIINVNKKYGERTILENINLVFREQEVTVLLGKSGEGKTTLFRLIAGIEQQDSGTIVRDLPKTTLVFQDNQLYPHLSALNNLVLPQRVILKRTKRDAIKRARGILKDLNIEYLENSSVGSLSGGEAQRVAIGRALAMDKNILLFDEPTSALDKENVSNLIGLLKTLKKDKTILIISHDEEFAYNVGDTVYQISSGVIKKA